MGLAQEWVTECNQTYLRNTAYHKIRCAWSAQLSNWSMESTDPEKEKKKMKDESGLLLHRHGDLRRMRASEAKRGAEVRANPVDRRHHWQALGGGKKHLSHLTRKNSIQGGVMRGGHCKKKNREGCRDRKKNMEEGKGENDQLKRNGFERRLTSS